MGRWSGYTFSQRHTDGEQAHENLLSITNDQGNANQNHKEWSSHTCQNDYQRDNKKQMFNEAVEKREP